MLAVRRDDAVPLLGRTAEVARLTALLDDIEVGGGALVLRGEPGIGKSRLLAEAAGLARERDMTVLSTTGVQSEAHLAFSGLHQLLRPVRERAAVLIPAHRAALDAAFGLTDGPPDCPNCGSKHWTRRRRPRCSTCRPAGCRRPSATGYSRRRPEIRSR